MSPDILVEIDIYDAPALGRDGCGCDHHDHNHGHSHHHPEAHGHDHCGCGHQSPEGGQEDCFGQAGMELQAKALAMTLWKAFPGKVQVNYINVLQDPRGAGLPQTKLLFSLAYPPPLVYLNGKGYFAGALPVERIRAEVAKILAAQKS